MVGFKLGILGLWSSNLTYYAIFILAIMNVLHLYMPIKSDNSCCIFAANLLLIYALYILFGFWRQFAVRFVAKPCSVFSINLTSDFVREFCYISAANLLSMYALYILLGSWRQFVIRFIAKPCSVFGANLTSDYVCRFCYIFADKLSTLFVITEFVSNLVPFCLQTLLASIWQSLLYQAWLSGLWALATFHAKWGSTQTYVYSFWIVEPPAGGRNPPRVATNSI